MEALELLQRYVTGERDFTRVELAEVNLCSANLIGIDLISDIKLSMKGSSSADFSQHT